MYSMESTVSCHIGNDFVMYRSLLDIIIDIVSFCVTPVRIVHCYFRIILSCVVLLHYFLVYLPVRQVNVATVQAASDCNCIASEPIYSFLCVKYRKYSNGNTAKENTAKEIQQKKIQHWKYSNRNTAKRKIQHMKYSNGNTAKKIQQREYSNENTGNTAVKYSKCRKNTALKKIQQKNTAPKVCQKKLYF